MMDFLLQAIKNEENKVPLENKPLSVSKENRPPNLMDKKEAENIMEKLLKKIVAKPNLIADDVLNEKIERMFNNALFQRMVEKAEIMHECNFSPEQQAKFLAKSGETTKKDLDEELPHFGQNEETKKKAGHRLSTDDIESPPPKPSKGQKGKMEADSQAKKGNNNQQNNSFGNAADQVITPIKSEENKFEKQLTGTEKVPSLIIPAGNDSSFINKSESFVFGMEGNAAGAVEEYIDDDDPGFIVIEVQEEVFEKTCKEVAEKYGFPARSIKPEQKEAKKKHKHKDSDSSDKGDSGGLVKTSSHKDTKKKGEKSKKVRIYIRIYDRMKEIQQYLIQKTRINLIIKLIIQVNRSKKRRKIKSQMI